MAEHYPDAHPIEFGQAAGYFTEIYGVEGEIAGRVRLMMVEERLLFFYRMFPSIGEVP